MAEVLLAIDHEFDKSLRCLPTGDEYIRLKSALDQEYRVWSHQVESSVEIRHS
jgi:hypothetical protein